MSTPSAPRKLLAAGLLAWVLSSSALPALAASGDDEKKGGQAPEAPLALLLPAAGAVAFGARLVIDRGRKKRG
ncbi:MAG: hypothetical protein JOZ39_04440 [Chloroflexi bacterium]|nr:hypothetical protein [Chloroflexota bacterium]